LLWLREFLNQLIFVAKDYIDDGLRVLERLPYLLGKLNEEFTLDVLAEGGNRQNLLSEF
jgi:hypothetical protein